MSRFRPTQPAPAVLRTRASRFTQNKKTFSPTARHFGATKNTSCDERVRPLCGIKPGASRSSSVSPAKKGAKKITRLRITKFDKKKDTEKQRYTVVAFFFAHATDKVAMDVAECAARTRPVHVGVGFGMAAP